jgi:hypothetical protein
MRQKVLVACLSLLFSLLALEVALRLALSPSARSYGTLFGRDLPPVRILPQTPAAPVFTDRAAWYQRLVVDGRRITVGDLWGLQREDPLLGYAPRENALSINGWWQSNNIGARARADTLRHKRASCKRILVLGDSYAQGSRIPQEQTWSSVLASRSDVEVVNLGVDGYSLAQAFLRYRGLPRLDHDLVLLMFAPHASLWRDLNTLRDLATSWNFYQVVPRFVVKHDTLSVVTGPYASQHDLLHRNVPVLSEELRAHLVKYDRFYFASKYEEPAILGNILLYKLAARAYYESRIHGLRANIFEDGEVLHVARRISEAMAERAWSNGSDFAVFVLPTHVDLSLRRSDTAYRARWARMVLGACGDRLRCVDLSEDLESLAPDLLDHGYDASHYGPKASTRIAGFIRTHLERLQVLGPVAESRGQTCAFRQIRPRSNALIAHGRPRSVAGQGHFSSGRSASPAVLEPQAASPGRLLPSHQSLQVRGIE